ncbi:precorrin-6y C5,15-methyltransferase (decarboxylating) subunit CbiE [Angustibacter aerolatus]
MDEAPTSTGAPVDVVGIDPGGWPALDDGARTVLAAADVVLGSTRQLALLPAAVTATRVAWPSPMLPALDALLAEHAGRRVAVLASGDPMQHGVGATLADRLGAARLRVHPRPSSTQLACARLGWAVHDVAVVSTLTQPADAVVAHLAPGRRVAVLVPSAAGVAAVAAVLRDRGWAGSTVVALSDLGGPAEQVAAGTAADPPSAGSDLVVVAVECAADPGTAALGLAAGLPDAAYDHDGQLTKRDLRATALARLAPSPGELLWDVGAGAGSVGVEWMRAHPSCRTIAVERDPVRAARVSANAAALGVPRLRVVEGSAPAALADLPAPDAVFVGGGATAPGLLDRCWAALRPGGRLVVHAVTLESVEVVQARQRAHGGELTRVQVEHAEPLGGFTVWRPALAVVQLAARKETT